MTKKMLQRQLFETKKKVEWSTAFRLDCGIFISFHVEENPISK